MQGSEGPIGRRNVVWGWCVMILGAVSGSILMAWSFGGPFPTPPGFADYTDLPRRLVRLAHVALFMLPLINIVLGHDLDRVDLSDRLKQATSWLAIVGMIGIPLGLLLGGTVHLAFKYLSSPAVFALLAAIALMAWGKVRQHRGPDPGP